VDAFSHVLQSTLRGPVNVTSPQAVTNADFTRTLGRVLRRPAFIPAPAFGVRLALGREMADETALAGPQVLPSRLASDGFTFRAPTLEGALRHSLGRPLD
jgi:NAD dependent epimerase/dehydratase family enzyme